jgi:hypothetical protein
LLKAIRARSQRFSHSRYTIRDLPLLLIEHRLGGRLRSYRRILVTA